MTAQKKPAKKEYFNAFSIRAIKRAIKNARRGLIPKRTSIAIDINSDPQSNRWQQIERLCRRNIQQMEEILRISPGSGSGKEHKSFTNRFVKEFYDHDLTREIFYILLDINYSTPNPRDLCERYKFYCCFGSHSSGCEEKWEVLMEYLRSSYFGDIEAAGMEDNEGDELLDMGLE